MREVVITGIGIISSLGNNISEVTNSLRNLKSGISKNIINEELGLRSHVSGSIQNLDPKELIDRKLYRFMGILTIMLKSHMSNSIYLVYRAQYGPGFGKVKQGFKTHNNSE